jgi:hypothetical protein
MAGLGSPESPENTFVHTRKKTRVDWKKPKTRNRLPQTSNFKLQTRNQKRETRNLKLYVFHKKNLRLFSQGLLTLLRSENQHT